MKQDTKDVIWVLFPFLILLALSLIAEGWNIAYVQFASFIWMVYALLFLTRKKKNETLKDSNSDRNKSRTN